MDHIVDNLGVVGSLYYEHLHLVVVAAVEARLSRVPSSVIPVLAGGYYATAPVLGHSGLDNSAKIAGSHSEQMLLR